MTCAIDAWETAIGLMVRMQSEWSNELVAKFSANRYGPPQSAI